MKFGVPILGPGLKHLPALAATYEANGFESVWIPEHVVFPAEIPPGYPYADDGRPPFDPSTPLFDPWVILGALAFATERIRFATNVYIAPLRHPLLTARSVITLDRLSRGRVTLGIGVGWLAEEFAYLGVGFRDRGSRTDAIVQSLRALWSEDVITVDNEHFRFGPLRFEPKPVGDGIPIEVGGVSRPALRRAGTIGDGWIEVGSATLDEFKAKLAVVTEARAEAGRDGTFEVTVGGSLAQNPSNYLALADAGATRIVVDPRPSLGERLTPQLLSDWSARFADQVIAPQGIT